ncbi:MAG: hypothetical protein BMS9Abin20_1197 [Acidimicrobiia bacterium]|nr:MAG: hypothetical protein BMS9Abin20_1197 [Acidimicrobiia bacterium]
MTVEDSSKNPGANSATNDEAVKLEPIAAECLRWAR